jgi:hypothetical protein
MATPGNFGGGSTGPDQIFLGIRDDIPWWLAVGFQFQAPGLEGGGGGGGGLAYRPKPNTD